MAEQMGTTSRGEALSGAGRDVVTLRLPAAGAYLSVLRTATASLASRLDFTIDDIEDLRIAVDEAGLTIVGDRFFQFEPHGVTGTVLLAESHLAIHTWPEAGFVTVDVYVCNYTTDNPGKAERVFEVLEAAFKPQRKRFQAIHRGGKDE